MSVDHPPVVDVHVHLSESKSVGAWSKANYEIWEYGQKSDVRFGEASGDLDDLRRAMSVGGIDHAVVVNTFSIDEWRERAFVDSLARLESRSAHDPAPSADGLIRFNEWLLDAVGDIAEITAFVAVDPWLLSADQIASHLEHMRARGAKGIKVHPSSNGSGRPTRACSKPTSSASTST
jgi:hypothetical protein